MEEKQDTDLLENVFKKVSYSTGFVCAKANKLRDKTLNLFQNAKGLVADIAESFKKGFESIDKQIKDERAQETEDKLKSIKENEFSQESQKMKDFSRELLNPDFEKEIEEMDRELAEI